MSAGDLNRHTAPPAYNSQNRQKSVTRCGNNNNINNAPDYHEHQQHNPHRPGQVQSLPPMNTVDDVTHAAALNQLPSDCQVVKQLMLDQAMTNQLLLSNEQLQMNNNNNSKTTSTNTSTNNVHSSQRASTSGTSGSTGSVFSSTTGGGESRFVLRSQQSDPSETMIESLLNGGGIRRLNSSDDNMMHRFLANNNKQMVLPNHTSSHHPHGRITAAGSSSGVSTSVESLGGLSNHHLEHKRAAYLIEALQKENEALRNQVQAYVHKSLKVQQLELNYQRVQREYEELGRRQLKRDELNDKFQQSLKHEILKLQEENRQLRDYCERGSGYGRSGQDQTATNQEITRLNMMIAQMMPENKELQAVKQRQSVEMQAQSTVLDEQRQHIHILDKAVQNAQAKVLCLEDDRDKRQQYISHLEQLNQSLQTANEQMQHCEQQHKQQRARLEQQIAQLHVQKPKDNQSLSLRSSPQNNDEFVNKLRRELGEKEEQLMELRQQNLMYERKCCELVKQREHNEDTDHENITSQMAKYSESLDSAERLIEELRAENETYRVSTRELKATLSGLENKLHTLKANCATKDAMIKVLKQQHQMATGEEGDGQASYDYFNHEHSDAERNRMQAVRLRLLQPNSRRFSGGSGATGQTSKWPVSQDSMSQSSDYSNSLGRPNRRMDNLLMGSLHRTQTSCDASMSLSRISGSQAHRTLQLADHTSNSSSTLPMPRRNTQQRIAADVANLLNSMDKPACRSHSADANIMLLGMTNPNTPRDLTNTTDLMEENASD